MEIQNKRIKELYESEKGKLILNLGEDRYKEYIRIINENPKYIGIINNIPQNLSRLEKVYYIYNMLGKLLYENNSLVYNYTKNLEMYYGTIRKGGIGNCRQMSELFVSMLKYANLIDEFYLTRKPVGVEGLDLRHIDAVLQVDGKLYMTDIIRDTVNMRAGIRNMKFGFKDSKEKRIAELREFLETNTMLSPEQKKDLIIKLEKKEFEKLLSDMEFYENDNNTDLVRAYLKNKIPKIEYINEIETQIGKIDNIPIRANEDEISIENLDKKIGNLKQFNNLDFPFDFPINNYNYFEDILKFQLIPRLIEKDSQTRMNWSALNNRLVDNSKNKNLELDIDIIADFIYKIAPNMDQEIFAKYLKSCLAEIYTKRYPEDKVNFKKWVQDNIKLYRMNSESVLQETNKNNSLTTFIIIRKFKEINEKERYICYRFSDEKPNILMKKSYKDILEETKQKNMKICLKFSKKCPKLSEELEK